VPVDLLSGGFELPLIGPESWRNIEINLASDGIKKPLRRFETFARVGCQNYFKVNEKISTEFLPFTLQTSLFTI